jgi:heme-degrading monooxygenase HmoA
MFARVTMTEGSPTGIDKAILFMRETVLPEGKKMKGFKGSYLLVDRKTGKQMGITLWETEADLNASTEAAKRLRAKFVQTASAQPAKVELYEVAVQP